MGWLLSLLASVVGFGLACAAALGAFALAWDVSRTKFKKQLHGVTARYDAALLAAVGGSTAAAAAAGAGGRRGPGSAEPGQRAGAVSATSIAAIYESFTLGWLNVLVQHLWLPVLEKFVSTIAAERLQIVLNELLRKNSSKGVWKYVQSIAVEEVTFGLAPPQLQFCTAKYDPSRSYLLLTMNLYFHSSGFQAVLTPRMQLGGMKPFTVRLEIMQLHLSGKLNLGLHLTKEPPGIKGVDYSFAAPPEFDIQASPVGYLNLRGELPGLINGLRSLLQRVINRRMVEPERRYVDLQRIYRNKHVQRVGGAGGCLRVCIIGGRNLMRPPNAAAAATAAVGPARTAASASATVASGGGIGGAAGAGATECDPYVELRFGREVFRTPIAHHTADPVFNWQFDLRLPADLLSGGGGLGGSGAASTASAAAAAAEPATAEPVLLYFRVLNARTLGEPEVLSQAVLDANSLGLQANGETRPKLLEMMAPIASAGGRGGWPRGTLTLQVSWLKALPKKASPFPQDAARAAASVTAAAVAAVPMPAQHVHGANPSSYSYNGAASTAPTVPTAAAVSQLGPLQGLTATSPAMTLFPDAGSGGSIAAGSEPLQQRTEQSVSYAPAAAFDLLTAQMQEVAGSAPMYSNASRSGFTADDSPLAGTRHGGGSSQNLGPTQHRPYSSMDESVASGQVYSRMNPEIRAARQGLQHSNLDSGSWQSLTAETARAILSGGGGGSDALQRQNMTVNASGDGPGSAAAPASGLGTPRRSVDTTTEGGSASGMASSSASVPTTTVTRRLKRKGFRSTTGGDPGSSGGTMAHITGGDGGGGGDGAATERKAAGQQAGPGKHRRAISGLLAFGAWKHRFSQAGTSKATAAASPLVDERRKTRLTVRAMGVDQNPEELGIHRSSGDLVTATGALELDVEGAALAATVAAANAAAAAAAAGSVIASSSVGGSSASAPGGLRPFGSPFTAERPRSPNTVSTTTTDGAAPETESSSSKLAMTTPPPPPPPLLPRSKRKSSSSLARRDTDGVICDGFTASYPTRAATSSGVAFLSAKVVSGREDSNESSRSNTLLLTPPGLSELRADMLLVEELNPVTPPQPPLPLRTSISLSPLPDADDPPSPSPPPPPQHSQQQPQEQQQPRQEQEREQKELASQEGAPGQKTSQGAVDKAQNEFPSLQRPESHGQPRQQQRQEQEQPEQQRRQQSAGAPLSLRDVDDPTRQLAASLSASSVISKAKASGQVAAAVSGGASGSGDGDSGADAAALTPRFDASDPAYTSTSVTWNEAATPAQYTPPPAPPPSEQQQQQRQLENQQRQEQQQPLNSTSRGSAATAAAASTTTATATAAAGGSGSAVSPSAAMPYPLVPAIRLSIGGSGGGSSCVRNLQRELSATSAALGTTPGPSIGPTESTGIPGAASVCTAGVGPLGTSPPSWSSTLQSLAQVVKMQRLLQAERQARNELYEMLSEMTRKYEAMVRIRRFENYRALVEGARFQLHLPSEVRRVVMWYNEARGVVQVDPDLAVGVERAQERASASELWPKSFVPQDLERAERGSTGFPNPSAWAGVVAVLMGRSRPPAPTSLEPMRCFSLHLEGARCLHLQLPTSGNGRSGDEWVDALQDLAIRSSRAARDERGGSAKPSKGLTTGSQQVATAATAAAGAAAMPLTAVGSALSLQTGSAGAGGAPAAGTAAASAGAAQSLPLATDSGGALTTDGRLAG